MILFYVNLVQLAFAAAPPMAISQLFANEPTSFSFHMATINSRSKEKFDVINLCPG